VNEALDGPHSGHGREEHGHPHHRDIIAVIDNVDVPLHRGPYDLDTLKMLGKVAAADTLLQLVGTKLERLPSDRSIDIRGGEIFASHPPGGGAS